MKTEPIIAHQVISQRKNPIVIWGLRLLMCGVLFLLGAAPAHAETRRQDILGCNNFTTMISGTVTDSADVGLEPPPGAGVTYQTGSARTEATDAAIAGASVSLFQLQGSTWVNIGTLQTNSSGQYKFCEMPYGSYKVEFCKVSYLLEYWNNQSTLSNANTIVIGNGNRRKSNINAVLTSGTGPISCP